MNLATIWLGRETKGAYLLPIFVAGSRCPDFPTFRTRFKTLGFVGRVKGLLAMRELSFESPPILPSLDRAGVPWVTGPPRKEANSSKPHCRSRFLETNREPGTPETNGCRRVKTLPQLPSHPWLDSVLSQNTLVFG